MLHIPLFMSNLEGWDSIVASFRVTYLMILSQPFPFLTA